MTLGPDLVAAILDAGPVGGGGFGPWGPTPALPGLRPTAARGQIALLAFGWLTGFMGAKAYLVAAAFAGAGGLLIWVSLAMQSPKQPGEEKLG